MTKYLSLRAKYTTCTKNQNNTILHQITILICAKQSYAYCSFTLQPIQDRFANRKSLKHINLFLFCVHIDSHVNFVLRRA